MLDFVTINWDKLSSPAEIVVFVMAVVAVGLAIWYLFNKKKADVVEKLDERTIVSYKERLEIVEKETQACHEQHNETKQMVKHLQGQLDAYSKMVLIPGEFLKELQRNQLEIIKLLKANKKKG